MNESQTKRWVGVIDEVLPRILLGGLLALYFVVVVRSAWLSDDAYITLRTVDNLVNGYGPTWNVSERVQAFTDPLWMLLLTAAYAFSRNAYFTTLGVSFVASIASVLIVAAATSRTVWNSILALALLSFSRAFVDFSTSGLETPLSFLCLASFVLVWARIKNDRNTTLALIAIAALAATTRLDTLLLYAPVIIMEIVGLVERGSVVRALKQTLIGTLPLVAWEVFAILYFGFPFPNTYYAKLQTAIPAGQLLHQGLMYLLESLRADPITVPVICLGIAVPFLTRQKSLRPFSIGIVAYCAYVVWIGGDFMNGRFLALPVFASALVLSLIHLERQHRFWAVAALGLVLAVGLVSADSTVKTGADFSYHDEPPAVYADVMENHHGVADERRGYFPETGLLNYRPGSPFPTGPLTRAAAARNHDAKNGVVVGGWIGMQGYLAGSKVHIVDYMALGDPLLARLPALPNWRIGHFRRDIPRGYVETLMSNRNQIADPDLAQFYDKLSLVIRGPIFAPERLRAIVAMNLGRYDFLIKRYAAHLEAR